jgi:hypothetical protein
MKWHNYQHPPDLGRDCRLWLNKKENVKELWIPPYLSVAEEQLKGLERNDATQNGISRLI